MYRFEFYTFRIRRCELCTLGIYTLWRYSKRIHRTPVIRREDLTFRELLHADLTFRALLIKNLSFRALRSGGLSFRALLTEYPL